MVARRMVANTTVILAILSSVKMFIPEFMQEECVAGKAGACATRDSCDTAHEPAA